MDSIRIRGARTHNLRNIDLDIPRNQLVVITGLSGSGKSSLAFDTLFAEGQRRYVESLSTYARQFLARLDKPDVDHIGGLSPAIAIEQKSGSHNPRSTVGTVTEIHDHLRLLFARAGTPRCPTHHTDLTAQTVQQMVDTVLEQPEGKRLMLLAPVVRDRKGDHTRLFDEWRARGFIRARIDGELVEIDPAPTLDGQQHHTIELVVDRFKARGDLALRLAESFETALKMSDGIAEVVDMDAPDAEPLVFSEHFACKQCGYTLMDLEPRLFSFNSPQGACQHCNGLGVMAHFDPERVVVDSSLSLASGAIRGWDKRNAYYYQMVQALGRHFDFDPEMPWAELSAPAREIILNGSGDVEIAFDYRFDGDNSKVRKHAFEGILPNMARRYQETDSSAVRDELSRFRSEQPCAECSGSRLNRSARSVFIAEKDIAEISSWTLDRSLQWLRSLDLHGARAEVATKVVEEAQQRLGFLVDVGLDYLSLSRTASTLSGGESQRIRLASQIGAGLVGVLYVLDEPSIGLHQRDNARLIDTLKRLRDLGNSVIVVEHDADAMWEADQLIDIGPYAGVHGGQVIAQGTPQEVADNDTSITGQYLAGKHQILLGDERRAPDGERWLRIFGARGNNLKNVDAQIPVGLMTCVTGVSGSGKSTLINNTLYPVAAATLNGAHTEPAAHDDIEGMGYFDNVVDIDQAPIGRTPRSNPATYTGLFAPIRELFANTPESRARGYKAGRFSFNVKGGRCEACQGDGLIRVEMHFLPDVYVPCDTCHGKRYNRETLDILYRGLNIHEVLSLTIEDALETFSAVPTVQRKLQTLLDVGLGYLTLGQSATTLSGGEAQRVKLARELSKRDSGRSLYILDEPTTGLHFHDVQQLLHVLARLRQRGNTIVIIEHNLDIIRNADWILDLGPEGGAGGGQLLISGNPKTVAECAHSYTGQFLKKAL